MTINYTPKGVCASGIKIDIEDGIIENVSFTDGCPGNLLGISQIVKGMKLSEVISKFEGIKCGRKPTSCPDQLAQALKTAVSD